MNTVTEFVANRAAFSEASFRARLRDAPDTRSVCLEMTRLATQFGFDRCLVLLDERDSGVFKVVAPQGYPEPEQFDSLRLRLRDEAVAQLVETPIVADLVLHEVVTTPLLATFGLVHGAVLHLQDATGAMGVVLAGQTEDHKPWPDTAPHVLQDLLPEFTAAVRNKILARAVIEDRAMLLAQKAEIEMLARELRRRNDEMLDDLEQARDFQAQMLSKPPRVPGVSIQFAYRPLDAVSGDFIDVSSDGAKIRVFVSDTTGHGLRAGLATMLLKAEYEAVKRATNPTEVLRELNSRIVGTYRSSALTMTAMCFDLELSTGEVAYASAAHPSVVVVNRGTARELATGGTLIGLVMDLDLKEGRTRIERGDGIYAYTDGISEAASPTNELFGEDRLMAALIEGHIAGAAVRTLEKAAVAFTHAGGFSDDATIVGLALDG